MKNVLTIAFEEKLRKDPLVITWNDWLSRVFKKYTLWVTITFPKRKTQLEAEKAIKKFFHKLNNGPIKFYDRFLDLFLFYENNAHGIHVHGVVSNISPEHIPALKERLFRALDQEGEKEFGQCDVDTIHEGVSLYLAKKHRLPNLEHFMQYKINSHEKRAPIKARPDLHAESFDFSLV